MKHCVPFVGYFPSKIKKLIFDIKGTTTNKLL